MILNIECIAAPLLIGGQCCQNTLTMSQMCHLPQDIKRMFSSWLKVLTKKNIKQLFPPTGECLTCAFFEPGPFLHGVAAEFAAEVVLPELSKPDIPSVVFQRSADEVTIKP